MRYYNRIAPIYNALYREEQGLKMQVALDYHELPRRGLILDLGCGTGLLASTAFRGEARIIVGLDTSKGMLSLVDPAVRGAANVHLVLADADHAPFRPECFDAVFALTLLQNMPSPRETLREMSRLAKLDAPIIVTGLKARFAPDSFTRLLKDSKLEARLLETDDCVKCHIALCSRRLRHKLG